ncbi:unnamed protein product, partial [Ectocarpus sp. 12 AP-2014]
DGRRRSRSPTRYLRHRLSRHAKSLDHWILESQGLKHLEGDGGCIHLTPYGAPKGQNRRRKTRRHDPDRATHCSPSPPTLGDRYLIEQEQEPTVALA